MDRLADIIAALAAIPDRELQALRGAIAGVPALVPGLFAWLESATDWEVNRRGGFHYELLGPHSAIDDTECASSLVALTVLSAQFRNDSRPDSVPVADFLDAAAAALRADPEEAPASLH